MFRLRGKLQSISSFVVRLWLIWMRLGFLIFPEKGTTICLNSIKAHIPVLVKVVRRYVHNYDTKMFFVWSAALSDIPRRKPDKNCAGGASVLCGVARWLLAMVGPVGDVKPRLGLAPSLCCPTNTLLVIFLVMRFSFCALALILSIWNRSLLLVTSDNS